MFKSKKKKIEFSNEELRIVLYALNDFRNDLIKEGRYVDAINDVMPKLKNKMKVIKGDLGVMINALDFKRKILLNENQDILEISELLLKILTMYEEF